jgi:hypothetical protein
MPNPGSCRPFPSRTDPSHQIADEADRHGFRMRWEQFCSYRLPQTMRTEPKDGLAHSSALDDSARTAPIRTR